MFGFKKGTQLMNLQTVSEFLDTQETCVLSTVSSEGWPMSATVGFSHDSEFAILIGTDNTTRKYKNLISNSKVSIVVGVTSPKTVQIQGVAKEVNADDIANRLELHFNKVPFAKTFLNNPGQRYFIIKPTWLRMTDYSQKPSIFETEEF